MSKVECRALHELGIVVGAIRVILYGTEDKKLFGNTYDKPLGDKELAELLKQIL